jgi:hypothetical protein
METNEGENLHSYLPNTCILIYRFLAFLIAEILHCYLPFTDPYHYNSEGFIDLGKQFADGIYRLMIKR